MTQVSPEAYNNIIRNFPGRQDQIDLLLRLFRRVSFIKSGQNFCLILVCVIIVTFICKLYSAFF
jgi:hypothetical protein